MTDAMSEERKEGVRKVWVSRNGGVWDEEPDKADREAFGPFHTAYLHDPPKGAPEPGERRVSWDGGTYEARHVYSDFDDVWLVAVTTESGRSDAVGLSRWLSLPLAPPKPKHRLAARDLTDDQAKAVEEFQRIHRSSDTALAGLVAMLLSIEEIPE